MVECDLAKVEVAGSNPVSRSNIFYGLHPLHRRQLTLLSDHPGPLTSPFFRNSSLRQAPSPSGKAEVCKTSTPGSNPGGASNF